MAEVKNSFIKSKMNKDLDARLLPNGEYREGNNIQVSKSEGADVGALENVLGNVEIADFKVLSGCNCNLTAIGMYTDNLSDNIYVFLTDYDETQNNYIVQNLNYSPTANNYVFQHNVASGQSLMLLSGAFLNFSKNKPILNVNLLEGILFWTDNRNQPRKITLNNATSNATSSTTNSFYTTEEQISVATYAPYQPINLYYEKTAAYNVNGGQGATDPTTPTSSAVTTINIPSSTLQGVNPTDLTGAVVTASTGIAAGTVIVSYVAPTLTISAPTTGIIPVNTTILFNANTLPATTYGKYVTSMLDATTQTNPDGSANANYNASFNGDPDFLEDKFVRFSYRFKYIDNTYSLMAPFTQAAFIPKQDGYFLGTANPVLPGNTKDEQNAYRSTVVDFMANKVNNIFLQIPTPPSETNGQPAAFGILGKDLASTFHVSEIEILYKESDSLAVKVVDTIQASEFTGLSTVDGVNTDTIVYDYQSTKPFKTLPDSELVRVYDKIPVRAQGQEIIGNRLVYSNFQNKHTPPASINYNATASQKYTDFSIPITSNEFSPSLSTTSSVEYPMHTLKQNRNYQIGVILSDKYGRSSTTILSSATSQQEDADGLKLSGDTIYFPYNVVDITGSTNNINSWVGDSIKVLFNQPLPVSRPNLQSLVPGVYNGDPTSSDYNPLGWYSYKIVVKQQEQEYYNVYLPGILNPYPKDISVTEDPQNTINTIVLLNDNINKVPRDLTEVGPEQQQFRSAVELYGRVSPEATSTPAFNQQYNPSSASNVIPSVSTVATIGKQNDLFDNTTSVVFSEIYQSISNPEIARLSQDEALPIGSLPVGTQGAAYNLLLGIYETKPFDSLLDIYYETSSTGTVHQLNTAILGGNSAASGVTNTTDASTDDWVFNLYENIQQGQSPNQSFTGSYTTVTSLPDQPFYPYKTNAAGTRSIINNSNIKGAITLAQYTANGGFVAQDGFSVTRSDGVDVSNKFTLIKNTDSQPFKYFILINNNENFTYGPDSFNIDTYEFLFEEVTDLDTNIITPVTATGKLRNIQPTITNCTTDDLNPVPGQTIIKQFLGVNGSPVDQQLGLSWHVLNQNPSVDLENGVPLIEINQDGELLNNTDLFPTGISLTVQLRDSGYIQNASETYNGVAYVDCPITINAGAGFTAEPLNENFGNFENLLINAGAESSTFIWAKETDIVNAYQAAPLLQKDGANPAEIPVNPRENITINTGVNANSTGLNRVQTPQTEGSETWYWWNTIRTNKISLTTATTQGSIQLNLGNNTGSNGVVTNARQVSTDSRLNQNFNPATTNSGLDTLNTGTAFIGIDYVLTDYQGTDDQPSVIWPTYLQYRASSADDFTTATDIEGRPIQFGGTQEGGILVNGRFTNDGSGSQYMGDGIIFDNIESQIGTSSSSTNTEEAWVKDSSETRYVSNTAPGTTNHISSRTNYGVIGRRVFAVGKNQAYRLGGGVENPDAPDAFGEYRLVVRYPYGSNTAGNVNPALTVNNIPSGAVYGTDTKSKSNQQVYLRYGDFYQGKSFRYRISQGFDSREEAESQLTFPQVVFAKEAYMRYVSHFYTDANLTNVYLPHNSSTKWHSYIGEDINYFGDDNASPNASGIYPGQLFEDIGIPSSLYGITRGNRGENDRKWVAQFDAGGKKVPYYASIAAGDEPAYPCEYKGTLWTGPPNGTQQGTMSITPTPSSANIGDTLTQIFINFNSIRFNPNAPSESQAFFTKLSDGSTTFSADQPIKQAITELSVISGFYPFPATLSFTCAFGTTTVTYQEVNGYYSVIIKDIVLTGGSAQLQASSNAYWTGL